MTEQQLELFSGSHDIDDVNSLRKGDKLIFSYPNTGYEFEQQLASLYLKRDEVYTVRDVYVDSWHTSIWLEEVSEPAMSFNSTMFRRLNEF